MSKLGDRIRSSGASLSGSSLDALPNWLTTFGVAGWLLVGIAGALAVIAWFFSTSSSISVPLLLALVIGMVAYPLCEKMTARGLSKSAAAAIVLLLLLAIVVGVVWITIAGIIAQWPSIQDQLQAGATAMLANLEAAGFDVKAIQESFRQASEATAATGAASNPVTGGLLSSVGSALTTGLSSTIALFFGLFIALTLLFYVLTDFPTVADWLAGHMGGLPKSVGDGILDDAVRAMRGYFRGTTITGFVVALMIGVAMLVLKVPLAMTVALVTFLTCYIPFFGAIISGGFAFVIALGSNGFSTAIILLVIVLIAQNVLQTVINARIMGESLNLHPLVVLVVTMLGGIFGGLLGAALGAPLAALLVSAGKRLSDAFETAPEEV